MGLLGVGLGGMARQQVQAVPAQALRPPAALDEAEFLGACVRCGLCVEACPYDTLKLARLFEPVTTGTPTSRRARPVRDVTTSPAWRPARAGRLDRAMTDIDQARMGVAVLIDHETCLNYLGLRCDVCYRSAPHRQGHYP